MKGPVCSGSYRDWVRPGESCVAGVTRLGGKKPISSRGAPRHHAISPHVQAPLAFAFTMPLQVFVYLLTLWCSPSRGAVYPFRVRATRRRLPELTCTLIARNVPSLAELLG